MKHAWTQEEFDHLRRPWAEEEARIYEERMATGYRREALETFTPEEAATMGALLDRLIPQSEGIDLVGFMDEYVHKPLGRGDRAPGMPDLPDLTRLGMQGLNELAQAAHGRRFYELDSEQQDAMITQVQKGEPKEGVWARIPATYFFERFYSHALHGYFSHPKAWMRIGFMGASYPEGYAWLGQAQVDQRRKRQVGWEIM